MIKKRWLYFLLMVVVIPIGLATRKYGAYVPEVVADYGGDTLYATLIFFIFRWMAIQKNIYFVAVLSYLACTIIETAQLYQGAWMVALRNTKLGGLILGHGFLWSDWICYALGVLLGLLIGLMVEKNNHPARQPAVR